MAIETKNVIHAAGTVNGAAFAAIQRAIASGRGTARRKIDALLSRPASGKDGAA